MEDRRLVSYLFASVNLVLLLFAVSFVTKVSAQQPVPKIIIGGESLSTGMAEKEAMKKLGNCCSITGGANPRDTKVKSFFIWNKDRSEILGNVWFRDGEVERVEREGEFSHDPKTISFALSFYRLLSQRAPSGSMTVALETGTSEATNASSKFITFVFGDGRSIKMEIVAPDDPKSFSSQISLTETLEKR